MKKIFIAMLLFPLALTAQVETKYDPFALFSPIFYPTGSTATRAATGEPNTGYWLQQNDKECVNQYRATWKDIEQVYDYLLNEEGKSIDSLNKLPSRDSARKDIDEEMKKELEKGMNEIFAKSKELKIRWNPSLIKDKYTKIQKTSEFIGEFYYLDGNFNIVQGDSIFSVNYGALLLNGQWRLVDINPILGISSKKEKYIEQGNFVPPVIVDTTIEKIELNSITSEPPPPPPTKKKSSSSKKEMNKPD